MEDTDINIADLDKVEVLRELYARARPLGLGHMHFIPGGLSREEAEAEIAERTYFDYLHGRVMKVDLSGESFSPWGFDRDNGPGSAQEAVNAVRAKVDGRHGRP